MSKKLRLREPFDKQHGKRVQAALKSASQQLYHIHWLLLNQLSWKLSLLLTCQMLGLIIKTLRADEMYPVLNRGNLTIPIQMQLSQKQKTFYLFLASILKSIWNFEHLDQKDCLIDFVFFKLWTLKTLSDKCLKSTVWENPLASNMANVPEHCWNLHHSIFVRLIDHC